MEFRILGPLEVVEEGRPLPLGRKLTRALLALLLLHANEPVSTDRLIEELWGEGAPRTATASLQNYVSRLRKLIGAERVLSEPGGYVLHVDPEQLDVAKFDRLVSEAHTASAEDRVQLLRAALALWRGRPLEDLEFEEFAQQEIAQLSERRLAATEERIAAELALADGSRLVEELEALIAEQPLRERLRALQMHALYRTGRQADALELYRETRRVLDEELGLKPSEELRRLERQILEHDPALGPSGGQAAAPAASRRTVTVLFCDVVDSTRVAMTLDPEAFRNLMSRYFDVVRAAIERHGGTVEKFIGDAVMAIFGMPERHEDDALRAVRAAVDVQESFSGLAEEVKREADVALAARVAVNTGEVMAAPASESATVTGAVVNIAAHLEKRAPAGSIVLGDETYDLVRDAVTAEPLELDDLRAWRLDELRRDAPARMRAFDTPLVGRTSELERLRAKYDEARENKKCRLVTVVGEPGIGKTRLARELVASVRDEANVVVGRCVAYGAGATYLPIAEIVRQVAEDGSIESLLGDADDADQLAQRVAEVIGAAEGSAAAGEAFWAVRRFFEALARERPLVVVFDDLHWAEPTLLDLVEYLGEWADAPILVLCLARRELLETRPGWKRLIVELEPLSADEVGRLVGELAGGPVAPGVQERIVAHAGGNPLFAEQLLALASEAPDVSLDQAPPTVEALIASRLDRLAPRELDVLQRASVIGRRFARTEIDDLSPDSDAELRSLERRGHVHPTAEGFRFHHILVRDVAYRGIPKAERAELHERVATNLDRRDGADEIIGYHFEQAYTYRVELARADEHAQKLAADAGDRLGNAGIRAWMRADLPAATNLLGRALALLPAKDPRRRTLLCELGIALRAGGDWQGASAVFEEAVEEASDANDRPAELRARLELAHHRSHHHTPGDAQAVTEMVRLAREAIPIFEQLGDDRALGRAWLILGSATGNFYLRNADLGEAAERAAHYYRRGGWSPSSCLSALMTALYYGPRSVAEAISRSEQLLQDYAGDPASEANILQWLGGLVAMRGRFEDAREHIRRAKMLYESLGLQFAAIDSCAVVLADVEMLAGRAKTAAQRLREACEICRRANESSLLSSRAAQLGDALYCLGQLDEAARWTALSREQTDPEDLHAQASWRAVASRLAARQGDVDTALSLFGEAQAIVDRSDALNQKAKLQLDLAEICRIAGREDEAGAAIERAIRLYETKGNDAATSRARSLFEKSALL